MFDTGYALQAEADSGMVRKLRKQLDMTQKEFALFLGCSKPTVERMEKDGTVTDGPGAMLFRLLLQHPELIEYYRIPERKGTLRMWYMFRDRPCTLIDVDAMRQRVSIRNYTDHLMFRAFGSNEKPDWNAYEEFLRSRCFPESRDQMKLMLRELDLPAYDPLMIIEKTEGRMAEDEFWIKLEE